MTITRAAWSGPSPAAPAALIIDLKSAQTVSGSSYRPRRDGGDNGTITGHTLETQPGRRAIHTGGPSGDPGIGRSLKSVQVARVLARYVRLTATSGINGYASVSEMSITVRPPTRHSIQPRAAWYGALDGLGGAWDDAGMRVNARLLASMFFMVPMAVFWACGGSNASSGGQDGGPGGPGPDGSQEAGSPDSGPPPKGYAELDLLTRSPSVTSEVVGSISISAYAPPPPSCHRREIAGCVLSGCLPVDAGPPVDAGGPNLGSVNWTGMSEALDGAADIPFELKQPPNTVTGKADFGGGEPIHVETAGGAIAGFADDFTVPLGLLVTSPAPDGYKLIMHHGQDLSLTWDRGKPGVFFYVQGTAGAEGGEKDTLHCYFPSEDGHGRIADAIFDGFVQVHFEFILTVAKHEVRYADYQVTTQVAFPILNPEKQTLTLEYR